MSTDKFTASPSVSDLEPWAWTDFDLTRSAIHEAGHIVACRSFGRDVEAVRLTDAGSFILTRPFRSAPELIRQNLVIHLAGCRAEIAYSIRTRIWFDWWASGGDDRKQEDDNVAQLHGMLGDRVRKADELATARRRATRLVEQRWHDVLSAAVALLRFHDVTCGIEPLQLTDLDFIT